ARPIGRSPQASELLGNSIAGFLFPGPNLFYKGFATQVMTRNVFRIQLAFDHNLGSNTCVVCSWDKCGVKPFNAVIKGQALHNGLVKGVSHVQSTRHVRWRRLGSKWLGSVCWITRVVSWWCGGGSGIIK